MLLQTIALAAAIAYALSFILSKRGLRYSTPVTITFVSLLMQTVVLFSIALGFTGIPNTPAFVFVIFVIAGVLQAVVRQLTYIGIEKIGAARSGPIRAYGCHSCCRGRHRHRARRILSANAAKYSGPLV
jgi:drug/metabolite transporter (DMT)-like permease